MHTNQRCDAIRTWNTINSARARGKKFHFVRTFLHRKTITRLSRWSNGYKFFNPVLSGKFKFEIKLAVYVLESVVV